MVDRKCALLNCIFTLLICPYFDCTININYKYFSITGITSMCKILNCVYYFIHHIIMYNNFNLYSLNIKMQTFSDCILGAFSFGFTEPFISEIVKPGNPSILCRAVITSSNLKVLIIAFISFIFIALFFSLKSRRIAINCVCKNNTRITSRYLLV